MLITASDRIKQIRVPTDRSSQMHGGRGVLEHRLKYSPVTALHGLCSACRHRYTGTQRMYHVHIGGVLPRQPPIDSNNIRRRPGRSDITHVHSCAPLHDLAHPFLAHPHRLQCPFIAFHSREIPPQFHAIDELLDAPRRTMLDQPLWVIKV
jgi:hypothetical protein